MKYASLHLGFLALGLGIHTAMAVDPLPPELENAPLKKQEEHWQRTSKESGVQRAKVAEQRYQAGLAYKQVLQTQMEDQLVAFRASNHLQAENSGASAGAPQEEEPTSWGLYGLMAALVCGGIVFMNNQMKQSEQIA